MACHPSAALGLTSWCGLIPPKLAGSMATADAVWAYLVLQPLMVPWDGPLGSDGGHRTVSSRAVVCRKCGEGAASPRPRLSQDIKVAEQVKAGGGDRTPSRKLSIVTTTTTTPIFKYLNLSGVNDNSQ